MGLSKKADATLMGLGTTTKRWEKVRTANESMSPNLVEQASDILGVTFNPNNYLLTHCTIVASVDTEDALNVKLGSFDKEGWGKPIVRKWADYVVTPQTDRFINNNNDAFTRQVLLKSYPTFIGAQNFLEHVQLEELSKGRIIDAAARDIGDSVYVDILVATDKTHTELIKDISSGNLTTLSMGCSIDNSTCTKCGNVADDEPQMCSHIQYSKGNYFYDKNGYRRRIAELCGHSSISPSAGVNFIEASWVKVPAFTGAVLRTILEAKDISPRMAKQIAQRLGLPPKVAEALGRRKAAYSRFGEDEFDFGEEGGDEGGEGEEEVEETEEEPEKEDSSFKDFEDEVVKTVLDRAKKRIQKELKDGEKSSGSQSIAYSAESLYREAALHQKIQIYKAGLFALARVASSDIELLDRIVVYDQSLGVDWPVGLYRAALTVGPYDRYKSTGHFITACQRVLRRQPSRNEAETMLRLGKLLSLRRH